MYPSLYGFLPASPGLGEGHYWSCASRLHLQSYCSAILRPTESKQTINTHSRGNCFIPCATQSFHGKHSSFHTFGHEGKREKSPFHRRLCIYSFRTLENLSYSSLCPQYLVINSMLRTKPENNLWQKITCLLIQRNIFS